MKKQKTILNSVTFSGIGLHSGVEVNIILYPALENTGIIFRRIDIDTGENRDVSALYNNVFETQLGTVITNENKVSVSTIEHLMSALWACDIDNILIEIDNKEVPIMDGSAKPFIMEIQKAGVQELEADRKFLKILCEVSVEDKDTKITIKPSKDYSINMEVDFPYGNIGKQVFKFSGKQEDFIKEVSKARTFCNEKEIEMMRKMGLARGGSLNNAMVFNEKGVLNEGGFRYDCEVARHKLLDCVGDMFTAGYFIQGKIKALKTGHGLNNKLLRKIFSSKENYEIV